MSNSLKLFCSLGRSPINLTEYNRYRLTLSENSTFWKTIYQASSSFLPSIFSRNLIQKKWWIETGIGIFISEPYPTVLETRMSPTIPLPIPISFIQWVLFLFSVLCFSEIYGGYCFSTLRNMLISCFKVRPITPVLHQWELNFIGFPQNFLSDYSMCACAQFWQLYAHFFRLKNYMNCAKLRILRIWWLGFILSLTRFFSVQCCPYLNLEPQMVSSYWCAFLSVKTTFHRS